MDPGVAMSPYGPLLHGEVIAASASLAAAAMFAASYARRQAVRRRNARTGKSGTGTKIGDSASLTTLPATGATTGLLLSGLYRGRSVEMEMAENGLLCITVRIENERRLFEEFGAGSPFPTATWLTLPCRQTLSALPGRWTVALRGRSLLLTCASIHDPERMPRLLELACDLADAADGTVTTPAR
jgi:hypothetical protein